MQPLSPTPADNRNLWRDDPAICTEVLQTTLQRLKEVGWVESFSITPEENRVVWSISGLQDALRFLELSKALRIRPERYEHIVSVLFLAEQQLQARAVKETTQENSGRAEQGVGPNGP